MKKYNYFSLTNKYKELGDEIYKNTGDEKWNLKPNHIKLLSIIVSGIHWEIAQGFEFDDKFFSALENEYPYFGFKLSKKEVISACQKLKEEGYLK